MAGKCCIEVSKSLEEIIGNKSKKEDESTSEAAEKASAIATSIVDVPSPHQTIEVASQDDETSCTQDTPVTKAPDRRRRRSSLGSLAQYVRRNSAEAAPPPAVGHEILANEAASRFQFRDLKDDPKFVKARIENRKNSM